MGSQMKRTIFDEQTAKALKKWHKAVVKRKHNKESSDDPSGTPSTDTSHTTTGGTEASEWRRPHEVPVRHLHRYKTIAHVGGARSPLSDSDYSDTDDAEPLSSSQTRYLIPPAKQRSLDTGRSEDVRVDVVTTAEAQDSFSFPRPPPPRHVPDKRASV